MQIVRTRADTSLWLGVVLTSMQRSRSDYVTVAKVLKDNLLFGSKFVGNEHENDIAEGDTFKIYKKKGWQQYPQ